MNKIDITPSNYCNNVSQYLCPQLNPLQLLLLPAVLPLRCAVVLVQLLLGVSLELAEGAGELVEVLEVLHQCGIVQGAEIAMVTPAGRRTSQ